MCDESSAKFVFENSSIRSARESDLISLGFVDPFHPDDLISRTLSHVLIRLIIVQLSTKEMLGAALSIKPPLDGTLRVEANNCEILEKVSRLCDQLISDDSHFQAIVRKAEAKGYIQKIDEM